MLMIKPSFLATRAQVDAIPTPRATSSWKPIPHSEVLDAVLARTGEMGLKPTTQTYGLMAGKLDGEELSGAKMFASIDFDPVGLNFPSGTTASLGIRNSHDKSFCLSVLSGARVFICSNGCLSAEHVVTRKHTSGIDLKQSIELAMEEFVQSNLTFKARVDHMRDHTLTFSAACELAVNLSRRGAFASDQILEVVNEYESPRHAEFRESNVWAMYNASTEIMKKQSPARQVDGFRALNEVCALLN